MGKLQGKIALVTEGNSGIGLAKWCTNRSARGPFFTVIVRQHKPSRCSNITELVVRPVGIDRFVTGHFVMISLMLPSRRLRNEIPGFVSVGLAGFKRSRT
jgi:NAD(P)-dependent dehydrogenase (short-subunit alcohol dehydrogenase family)